MLYGSSLITTLFVNLFARSLDDISSQGGDGRHILIDRKIRGNCSFSECLPRSMQNFNEPIRD